MSRPEEEPPPTRRESVTETLHGEDIADPYRWLEGDGDAVREWTEAQNEYADTHLDEATRKRLQSRLEALGDVPEYGPVEAANGRYFQQVRRPDDDHARLLVRKSPDGEATVLVDPNEWSGGGAEGPTDDSDDSARSMTWFLPSPDGERVAYGVTEGGDERVDIRVVTVPDAEEVAVREDCGRVSLAFVGFDPTSPGMVAWGADSEGLYYVATGGEEGGRTNTELRRWRFDGSEECGGSGACDGHEETLFEHADGQSWPLVRTDPDSGTVAVAFHDVSGTDWYVWNDEGLRPVLADSRAETFVAFHDGTVFLQTDREAPRKRLLRCSLARFREGELSLAECETVLAEREAVLQSFVVTADHVVANYLDDAHSRLAVHDHDGDHVRDLPLPDYASVSRLRGDAGLRGDPATDTDVGLRSDPATDTDAEQVFYRVESFHRSPTLVRADPSTGDRRELARADVEAPENLVVRQRFVESTDGAEVPLFVCHRADVEPDGDNPAVLHGYGGFRSSRPPSFDRFRVPFLADGGVYAQVCARGGQEYGEPWHEDATLADKQHTFDDFIAAGEFLREAGYADPDRLAVTGRSNGGLSVGAVVTQRPDLWAAAHCAVSLLDMLRYHRFGMGESWTGEYGDPGDPEAFEYLRSYSPYHSVETGVEYPPVLFTTGADDTRVHPCHARKMAARLQAEADGGPFVLRTWTDSGHGVGESASTVVSKAVEKWTFLYDRLGMGAETASDEEE